MKRNVRTIVLIAVITIITMSAFAQTRKPEKVKDPVCGLMVEKNPALSATHKGETYHFCSKADMETFKKSPDKYVKKPG
jgi:YHS domain-containing protein